MSNLEKVKSLIKSLDDKQRKREDALDSELDEIDALLDTLTEYEGKQVEKYSTDLMESWTPIEKYYQAMDVLKNFPKPHPNDVTTPEARKKQKDYWIGQRDKALLEIDDEKKKIVIQEYEAEKWK